jgi:glutathione S-transferase
MRPFLALSHAGADFQTETVELDLGKQLPSSADERALAEARVQLGARRALGSVTGLFPVLHVGDTKLHESLAICEWVNEAFPEAQLWPEEGLSRARARSLCCEMTSSFTHMRTHMSCHLFGRVPSFVPNAATRMDIARVVELWQDALERSGGPFLFGRFSLADAMYYPVRTRFRTYGIALPENLSAYVAALDALPAVQKLETLARKAPSIATYDATLRSLGGDPDAAL